MISGNLFTRDYLLEGIRATTQWASLTNSAVGGLRAEILTLAQGLTAGVNPNEAQTEKDLIYPVLALLGWTDLEVQQTLSKKGRKQVPDALLFADREQRDHAVAQKDPWKRYQFGLAVVEAKRWKRALDRADKKEEQEEGVPSTQMLQYLSRVDVQTGGKVRMGILTNGVKWRLYFQGALSVSEDYLELDLAKALGLPGHEPDLIDLSDPRLTTDHVFRLFLLMFSKRAFLPSEGQLTFHDLSRQAGKLWEEKVTKDLSALVFEELFPMLVTNLHKLDQDKPAAVDAEYLEDVRQGALILLYRLLFVVYAEDRDLLPDRKEPYKSYSLTTVRLDVAQRIGNKQVFSATQATYWPKLAAVFKAIAEGDDELGIPPYNGGLFAKETAPILQRIVLPDAVVADLVFKLSHRADENGGAPRYINYRDLTVQQLGTIYERTLEYGLKVENGAVTVDADDTARHESGSYYTPDSLVSLIIDKTVGPLVEECRAAFARKNAELAKDTRRQEIKLAELQGYDPALAILELRVCDPAMGSGHFLVNLVDWLADKTLASIAEAEQLVDWADTAYRSPVLSNIEQTRADIIRQATKHKWPFELEHLDDRHIIRRTILKRCVYGVDKNPMAVELGKVALWLHTFTVGAPLSFLDHHLRQGNSLFGFWVSDAIKRVEKWGGQLLINEPMKNAMAQAMAMQKLERVNDIDIGEVHQSKTIFDGIEQETKPFNTFVKVLYAIDWLKLDKAKQGAVKGWLDGQFGDPFDIARGKITLGPSDNGTGYAGAKDGMWRIPEPMRKDAELFAGILNEARAIVRKESFHNWQIAFPGVWKEWDSPDLKGGFDAVIGNPPYVRQELIKDIKPALKRAFPKTYDGSADLYVYFYDQGFTLLQNGGRLSYVVTNKWMRAGYGEGVRELFSSSGWLEFIADFGHAKKFFPDADVFPSVLVARKPDGGVAPQTTDVCVIPRDDVPQKGLEEAVANATFTLPRAHFAKDNWVLERPEVVALLHKIRQAGVPLKEYAQVKSYRGVLTGFNKAFLIDSPTRDKLIAEHASADKIIKPYLRGQDVGRWEAKWQDLWMIFARRGINIDDYPSVKRHLERFRTELAPKPADWKPASKGEKWPGRKEGDYAWYELQDATDYWEMFERPKIVYQVIQYHPRYCLDADNRFTNDKSFILPTDDVWLLAVLNSPLMWWHNWRKLTHLKDEALSPMGYMFETLPIATPTKKTRARVETLVDEVSKKTAAISHAQNVMLDWLRHEFEIVKPGKLLANVSALEQDGFIAAVKAAVPKKRKLTAADVAELNREYHTTAEPAAKLRAQVRTIEEELSVLVCDAYGLTADEQRLMWATAPVRMPLASVMADEAEAEDDDAAD